MKKIISFEKKLEFPSMVGEVTSISLEHTLSFASPSFIEGEFKVSGTYKLTEASCIEDKFDFKIPTEIILNEKLDTTTTKIEIDDFYYEIENDENLICYIDVLVEGVEEIEDEAESTQTDKLAVIDKNNSDEKLNEIKIPQTEVLDVREEDSRECDGDLYQEIKEDLQLKEEQLPEREEEKQPEEIIEKETTVMTEQIEKTEVGSLFSSLKDDEDTFATYSVYILRQEENLQTIIEKYKVTKEELEDYNDLSNITVGSKIIIPLHE